jgi:tetratricopeptide (TPR) repeat protein/CheY-like chemotaxis protein
MAEATGRLLLAVACVAMLAVMAGCADKAGKKPDAAAGDGEALIRAGDAALSGGNAGRALAAYAKAKQAGADEALVLGRVCRAHLAGRTYRQALDACRAALEARPDDPEALYGAGYAALMQHDAQGAVGYFEKALELRPDHVRSARMLGLAHHQARDPEKAALVLRKTLETGGDDADTENNLGLALLDLGRSDEAVAAFTTSLALKDSPRTRNNLGLALCRAERFEEAYAAFLAAGGEAAAHNNLGVCYRELGMADKAAAEFEAAIARKPQFYRTASDNLERISTSAPPSQEAPKSPDQTQEKKKDSPVPAVKEKASATSPAAPATPEKKPRTREQVDAAEATAVEKIRPGSFVRPRPGRRRPAAPAALRRPGAVRRIRRIRRDRCERFVRRGTGRALNRESRPLPPGPRPCGAAHNGEKHEAMPATRHTDSPETYNLLIADDEPQILALFKELLAPGDEFDLFPEPPKGAKAPRNPPPKPAPRYEVVSCRQGEEAVEAVRTSLKTNRPFSVAFLDVPLPPGRGGLWAAEEIRRLDPDVQIVIMTAISDIERPGDGHAGAAPGPASLPAKALPPPGGPPVRGLAVLQVEFREGLFIAAVPARIHRGRAHQGARRGQRPAHPRDTRARARGRAHRRGQAGVGRHLRFGAGPGGDH